MDLLCLYNKYIVYTFIILLLLPAIYYIIRDISKDSKYIQNKKEIDVDSYEKERKMNYDEVKKYCKVGIFRFSLYLTFIKYPYFSVFNKCYKNIPIFIRHSIIITGLFIGIITPLIPYLFIHFTEREIFISQRDINFEDIDIKNVPCDSYKIYSLIFSPLGLILGNLFIYFFAKKLNFENEEVNIWLKIKTICKDYIYYEVKSEVLLGSIWLKIKTRMQAYYLLCGKYVLRKNRKKNNKFKEYLKDISRTNAICTSNVNSFCSVGQILPRTTVDMNYSKDINNQSNREEKLLEMEDRSKSEHLIDKEEDENENLLERKNIYGTGRIYNNNINTNHKYNNSNLSTSKIDNFILDNKIKIDKSKRQISRFEKVRNKYIYVRKNIKELDDEIEGEENSNNENDKNTYEIDPQNNYSYISVNSFISAKKSKNGATEEANKLIHNCIFYSFLLLIIIVIVIAFTLFLVRHILDTFDVFILKAWIFPIIIVITVINFLLYFIKMFIGTFILFHFYHLRKKRCCFKWLFWIFVDRPMIQIYKIRNLITKYKKEFDYL